MADGILYKNTDMLQWGAGKGAPLSSVEIDENMYHLYLRLVALENDPPTAVSISNIQVVGTQLLFYMSDGSTFGPFTLPVGVLKFRDEYVAGTQYYQLDIVTVAQKGLFLVNFDYLAPVLAPFDEFATVGGNLVYTKVFGEDVYIYDFGFSYPGKPGQGISDGEEFAQHLFLRDVFLPTNLLNSRAKLGVACTAQMIFPIMKNGTRIGTLTFEASTVAGVFAWDSAGAKQFTAGDTLGLAKSTGGVDATAKRLAVTFAGTRGSAT